MSYLMSDEEFFQNAAKIEQDEKNRQYWIAKEKEAIEKFSPPGIEFFKSLIPGQIEPAPKGAPDAISSDLGLIDPVELAVDLTPIGLAAGVGLGALKKVDKALPSVSGFTSKLEDVIRQKMGGKATAQEIGAMVKQAGVKQEELDDIAFEQWLQGTENTLFEKQGRSSLEPSTSVQTPKIPKEDVLGYLKAERPELKEVKYKAPSTAEYDLRNQLLYKHQQATENLHNKKTALELMRHDTTQRILNRQREAAIKRLSENPKLIFISELGQQTPTQVAVETLQNLSSNNYDVASNADKFLTFLELTPQEINKLELEYSKIRMPDKDSSSGFYYTDPDTFGSDIHPGNKELLNAYKEDIDPELVKNYYSEYTKAQDARRLTRNELESFEASLGKQPRWARYSLSGHGIGENYREYVFTAPFTDRTRGREIFKSESHWPNVEDPVYHIRAQDLTDKDGDNLLNVDEIQSDVHQYGQKFGYKKREMTEDEREKAIQILRENGAWRSSGIRPTNTDIVNQAMYLPDEEFAKIQPIFKEAGLAVDLPYKKTWHEQAMRRMIKEALDSGKDGVSWTAGSVQAKRAGQDLGEVTSIAYDPATNHLAAYRDGFNIFDKTVPQQKLSQYVGSGIAKQFKDGAAKQLAERKAWKIAQQKQDDAAIEKYREWLTDKFGEAGAQNPPLIDTALKSNLKTLRDYSSEPDASAKVYDQMEKAGLTPIQISDLRSQRIEYPPQMDLIEVPVTSESFGGSGMKKFYDEKLLNFARQEAKRLGGTVIKTTVKSNTGEEIPLWKFKFGPKTKEAVKEKGLPLYVLPTAVGLGEVVKEMKKEQESKKSD